MGVSKFLKSSIFIGAAVFAFSGVLTSADASVYCEREAKAVADEAHSPGEAAVVSGLGSAAVGALIGGIASGGRGAGRGAAIGGVAGAMGGAIGSSAKWRDTYNRAYRRCVQAHSQPAQYQQPVRRAAPPEGTQEWIDYCARKYKSFDPQTGMYLAYSGKYRRCQ